jgi:predicted house-cleaning noncanonical NTP pyrophosphatase (MazG superfamily)
MRITHNKLIRDRIPEIIEADGRRAVTRILEGEEYRTALLAKLVEEAREAENASADELADELADVWEVLHALLSALPLTRQELEALAAVKRGKRGGFDRRMFLEYTEQGARTHQSRRRRGVCARVWRSRRFRALRRLPMNVTARPLGLDSGRLADGNFPIC